MLDPNGHGETLVAPEAAPSVRLHRWARHAQAHAVASVIGAGIVATARAVQRAARQFFALKPPATAQLPR
jgi:hypothetical protein